MSVKVKVFTGKVETQLKGLSAAKIGAAKREVARGANNIRTEAIELIRKPSGQYKLYDRGHYSSPPGTAPNTDLGNLQNNIVPSVEEDNRVASVVSKAEYSKFLEFGTKHMEPRPFMGPAFQTWVKRIMKAIRKAIRNG